MNQIINYIFHPRQCPVFPYDQMDSLTYINVVLNNMIWEQQKVQQRGMNRSFTDYCFLHRDMEKTRTLHLIFPLTLVLTINHSL